MRIRKQAKLTGVSVSNGIRSGNRSSAPIKLNCQLSKSPWDIISLSSQIDGEYSYTPDGSSTDSLRAYESAAALIKLSGSDGFMNLSKSNGEKALVCGKTDEKSWKCRNEVAEGKALCEQHLNPMKGENGAKGAKTRRSKIVAPSSETMYYFYTGFGPCWTKRRGTKTGRNSEKNSEKGNENNIPMEVEEEKKYDYIIDYDSEEEEEDEEASREGGKKRGRKPIKARSLKSLM